MTLQQLSYLIKVAECGNITDAAEQLYISQPSLSTAISNLEKEMGVTAFIRTKKGVIVTHEGEELLSFARMLLEQADIMKEHFGVVNKSFQYRASIIHLPLMLSLMLLINLMQINTVLY